MNRIICLTTVFGRIETHEFILRFTLIPLGSAN